MGNYDTIQDPVQGQPISSSLFGQRVKAAIVDLDRRMSAYDASTGIGKALATSQQNLANNNETITLTIANFTFRAGYAYQVSIRMGLSTTFVFNSTNGYKGPITNIRLRKGSSLTLSGTTATNVDYGEFFRFHAIDGSPMMVNGSLYLLRSPAADLTVDFSLTLQSTSTGGQIGAFGNANSPRYMVIAPAGFASDYAGMGVDVT